MTEFIHHVSFVPGCLGTDDDPYWEPPIDELNFLRENGGTMVYAFTDHYHRYAGYRCFIPDPLIETYFRLKFG